MVEPELYGVRGELLLTPDPPDEAEAKRYFRTAIDIARRQKARLQELRATTSLARLLQRQGKRDEARAMLAETYGWFTKDFDIRRPQRRQGAARGTERLKEDAGQDALFEVRLRQS